MMIIPEIEISRVMNVCASENSVSATGPNNRFTKIRHTGSFNNVPNSWRTNHPVVFPIFENYCGLNKESFIFNCGQVDLEKYAARHPAKIAATRYDTPINVNDGPKTRNNTTTTAT